MTVWRWQQPAAICVRVRISVLTTWLEEKRREVGSWGREARCEGRAGRARESVGTAGGMAGGVERGARETRARGRDTGARGAIPRGDEIGTYYSIGKSAAMWLRPRSEVTALCIYGRDVSGRSHGRSAGWPMCDGQEEFEKIHLREKGPTGGVSLSEHQHASEKPYCNVERERG